MSTSMLEQVRTLYGARSYPAVAALLGPADRARLLREPEVGYLLADSWRRTGEREPALELMREVRRVVQRRGGGRLHRDCLNVEGAILFERGEVAEAERTWLELLEVSSREGDEEFVARANNNLGIIYTLHGRPEEGLASYERAIASYQRIGYRRGLAQGHQNVAIIYRELGFAGAADTHFRRALAYAREDGSADEAARVEEERALLIYYTTWDSALAEATARSALRRFRALADRGGEGEVMRVLGIVALGDGRLADARGYLEVALELARRTSLRLLEAETVEALAALAEREGYAEVALASREEAAAIFEAIGAVEWGRLVRRRMDGLPRVAA